MQNLVILLYRDNPEHNLFAEFYIEEIMIYNLQWMFCKMKSVWPSLPIPFYHPQALHGLRPFLHHEWQVLHDLRVLQLWEYLHGAHQPLRFNSCQNNNQRGWVIYSWPYLKSWEKLALPWDVEVASFCSVNYFYI